MFADRFDFSNAVRLRPTRRGDNVGFALNQPIPKNTVDLRYGVSITNSCIGWETTDADAAVRLHDAEEIALTFGMVCGTKRASIATHNKKS